MNVYKRPVDAVAWSPTKWDGFRLVKTEHPYKHQQGSGRAMCLALAEDGMFIGDWTKKCAEAGFTSDFAIGSILKLMGAKEPGWRLSPTDDQGKTIEDLKNVREVNPERAARAAERAALAAEAKQKLAAEREEKAKLREQAKLERQAAAAEERAAKRAQIEAERAAKKAELEAAREAKRLDAEAKKAEAEAQKKEDAEEAGEVTEPKPKRKGKAKVDGPLPDADPAF